MMRATVKVTMITILRLNPKWRKVTTKVAARKKKKDKEPFLVRVENNPRSLCFCFTVIGPENSYHSLNQSDATKINHKLIARVFPQRKAVWLVLHWVLIGSYRYFPFFSLVVVSTLVLDWRHSIKKPFFQDIKISRHQVSCRVIIIIQWYL